MKLHYQWLPAKTTNKQSPAIVLLHGLFGNLDNLGVLARDLNQHYDVLQVDLRNHGLSPHAETMSYEQMATDVALLLDDLHLEKVLVIGHSMGGKTAMALTKVAPTRIEKLIVIDIAPVSYELQRHNTIFDALLAVNKAHVTQRQDAALIMRHYLDEETVIQFLLKSFHQGEWRFNLSALIAQYLTIIGWHEVPAWPHPVLFICGSLSSYVQVNHRAAIMRQFPLARAHIIAGAGHWAHAENPKAVLNAIYRFLGHSS